MITTVSVSETRTGGTIDIQNPRKLAELGSFCRTMGRDARQGEIGLVIGDEYLAIRDFAQE